MAGEEMTKLNDYLAKVQSNEERDRLAEACQCGAEVYENDADWCPETFGAPDRGDKVGFQPDPCFQAGYDARTRDIQVLCEIVSIYKDKIDLYLNHDPNINWLREAVEEIEQLITERIEG